MSECIKVQNDVMSFCSEQSRQLKKLETCINLMKDKIGLLKQKELTSCDMRDVHGRVVDVESDMGEVDDGLHRHTFS